MIEIQVLKLQGSGIIKHSQPLGWVSLHLELRSRMKKNHDGLTDVTVHLATLVSALL